MRVGILASHPIQYQVPWFRALARKVDLQVFFAIRPSPDEQGIGFGRGFSWDIDLLSGYEHKFLHNVARTRGSSRFNGCDTPEIAAEINRGKFNSFIVSGWNLKSYWQAVRACRKSHYPVLVRGDSQLDPAQSRRKTLGKKLLYPRILRQFNGFLSVGKRNREYLLHYGVPQERIFFVPHFVDNQRFAAATSGPSRSEVRYKWRVADESTVVLFVGKFIPKKRPGDIIESLAILRQRGVKIAAVFVGAGILEQRLRSDAARHRIQAQFEGFRNQTELPGLYVAADVLVLPSDAGETWGLVVNEAMACGLPAIVSNRVGCGPDLIDEGETGFTYPCGEVDALAARLAEFVYLRRKGGSFRNALLRKIQRYSVEFATEQTLGALRTIAKRYSAAPEQLA